MHCWRELLNWDMIGNALRCIQIVMGFMRGDDGARFDLMIGAHGDPEIRLLD